MGHQKINRNVPNCKWKAVINTGDGESSSDEESSNDSEILKLGHPRSASIPIETGSNCPRSGGFPTVKDGAGPSRAARAEEDGDSSRKGETSRESGDSKQGQPRSVSKPNGSAAKSLKAGGKAALDGGAGPSQVKNSENKDDSSSCEENPCENDNGSSPSDSSSAEGDSAEEDESEEEEATAEEGESKDGGAGDVLVEDAQTNSDDLSSDEDEGTGKGGPSLEKGGSMAPCVLGKQAMDALPKNSKIPSPDLSTEGRKQAQVNSKSSKWAVDVEKDVPLKDKATFGLEINSAPSSKDDRPVGEQAIPPKGAVSLNTAPFSKNFIAKGPLAKKS